MKLVDTMSTEQYSLRWNNYSSHISGAFDSLRTEEDLVDVTLCCDGGKIRAHKIMLSACSPYFRELFKDNPCQHPIVILRHVQYVDLSAIVAFMYQGEVNVASDQLTSFLQTAEMLQVRGLTDSGRDTPESRELTDPIGRQSPGLPKKINAFGKAGSRRPLKEESTSDKSSRKRRKIAHELSPPLHLNQNNGEDSPYPRIRDSKSASPTDLRPFDTSDLYDTQPTDELIDVSEINTHGEYIPEKLGKASYQRKEENEQIVASPPGIKEEAGPSVGATSLDPDDAQGAVDKDELLFRCRVCWKGFKHPMSLTLHRDAHEGKTECPVCRKHFSRSYDMRSHLTRVHKMNFCTETAQ